MTDPIAVQFKQALDLLDDLTEGMLPLGGVSNVWYERISLWKLTARSLVNDHLKEGRMGNTVGEKVRAIRQAWDELVPADPPITYDSGPLVSLDLLATVAVNVLTDWHKRDAPLEDTPRYRYPHPVRNPLETLTCDACWHPASQHGFVFDPHDWSISHTDLKCSFPSCICDTFTRVNLPPFTPGTEMVP